MKSSVILIVGTIDTKSDEIGFMREQVQAAGGQALIMDVGVLAKGRVIPDIANTDVAAAAGVTLQQVMDSGDENSAMALMALGGLAAWAGGAPIRTASLRMLFWGGLAMGLTALVGRIFGAAV